MAAVAIIDFVLLQNSPRILCRLNTPNLFKLIIKNSDVNFDINQTNASSSKFKLRLHLLLFSVV